MPCAELLSIGVDPHERRKGLATASIRASFAECSIRAIEQVKVLVGASTEPASRLYFKCGFGSADQINNHGVASNIYIAETRSVLKVLAPAELPPAEEPRPGKAEIVGIPSKSAADERIGAKQTDE